MYRVYKIPDDGSYKLERLPGSELIYLNELSWSPTWLKWAQLKSLFEGESFAVGRPKNRGGQGNVMFDEDAPVIGSCPSPIRLFTNQGGAVYLNEYETAQMNSRVTYINLTHTILYPDVVKCPACISCAARLYLEGEPAEPPPPPAHDPRPRSRSPRRGGGHWV